MFCEILSKKEFLTKEKKDVYIKLQLLTIKSYNTIIVREFDVVLTTSYLWWINRNMYFGLEYFLNLCFNLNGAGRALKCHSVGTARAGRLHSSSNPHQMEPLLNVCGKSCVVWSNDTVGSFLERLWARCHLAVSPCMWSPSNAELLDLNNFLWQGVPQWIVFAYPVFLASFPLVSFSLGLVLWNVHETFFTLFLSRSCLYIFLSNNVSLWSLLNYIYSLCWLF